MNLIIIQKKSFKLFGELIKSEFSQIYNFQAILCKIVNCNFFNILRNSMDYLNIIDEIDARKGNKTIRNSHKNGKHIKIPDI